MELHSLVEAIVNKYHTRNPFEIARATKTIVVFAPLKDIRGFYQYFQRNHIIYIDEDLAEQEKMFVCAHELGHRFLHKNANAIFMDTKTYLNTNKFEHEANTFAAELLIPDEILLEHWHYTTDQLSRLLGYDKKLVDLRLESYREI